MNYKKTLTQWGSYAVNFSEFETNALENYIRRLKSFIHYINDKTELDILLTYGSLLGAVREKKIISHDFDFDFVIIIKNQKSKYDLIERFQNVAKLIKNHENVLHVTPASSSQFAACLKYNDTYFTIDFFLGWFENENYYQAFSIDDRFEINKCDIYPTATFELNGIGFKGPNNSSIILESIYGKNWEIPDQYFNYKDYFENLGGTYPYENTIFGRLGQNIDYWDKFYKKKQVTLNPSQFAIFSNDYLKPNANILELGAGNGRDSYYLAKNGHKVTCTDYSVEALAEIESNASTLDIKKISTAALDYANYIELNAFCESQQEKYDYVYSRFLFHAISEAAQLNLIIFSQNILVTGGKLISEFRISGDQIYDKRNEWNELELTGDHYRRPVNINEFRETLLLHNFKIDYCVIGKGYAYNTNEDPTVCRIVATVC